MSTKTASLVLLATMATTSMSIAASPQPHDWYLLNFGKGHCQPGSRSPASTPAKWHEMLRANGIIDSVTVRKDDDGNVTEVQISHQSEGGTVAAYWYPSPAACEVAKEKAIEDGDIASDADLK